MTPTPKKLKKCFGELSFRFAYPEIESTLKISGIRKDVFTANLKGCYRDTRSYPDGCISIKKRICAIRLSSGEKVQEIIIQDGKLLNREVLSSGTAEGVDVAIFLAAMLSGPNSFYYCDEHFSYIQTDIEKGFSESCWII